MNDNGRIDYQLPPDDSDPNNFTLAKFEAFVNALETPDQLAMREAMTKAQSTLGALLSDKPSLSPHILHSARVMMTAAIIGTKPELAPYINAINEDAKEIIYIEDMRRVYGDAMVNAALDDARTSYRTFYHSLQLRIMAQRLNNDFGYIREAFSQLGKALGETLARGFANVPLVDQPKNREERRSAKYGTRRKKESDQLWARRSYPKRRR